MDTKEIQKHLEFLNPSAREVLNLSKEKRIEFIMSNKFVSHPFAQKLFDYLRFLLDNSRQIGKKAFLIHGKPKTGKTMTIYQFWKKFGVIDDDENSRYGIPVPLIDTPSHITEKALYNAFFDTLGLPYKKRESISEKLENLKYYINFLKVKMLIFDEFHNILNIRPAQRKRILVAVKCLPDAIGIPVVIVGREGVWDLIQSCGELKVGFTCYEFEPYDVENDNFSEFLKKLEASLPLRQPSYMWKDRRLAEWLVLQTGGVAGEIIRLVKLGAVEAIRSGKERITLNMLREMPMASMGTKK